MGPARFHCATLLLLRKKDLSEGRFELPPTEVDCDLNAAP